MVRPVRGLYGRGQVGEWDARSTDILREHRRKEAGGDHDRTGGEGEIGVGCVI